MVWVRSPSVTNSKRIVAGAPGRGGGKELLVLAAGGLVLLALSVAVRPYLVRFQRRRRRFVLLFSSPSSPRS
jgi:hypothetical protein